MGSAVSRPPPDVDGCSPPENAVGLIEGFGRPTAPPHHRDRPGDGRPRGGLALPAARLTPDRVRTSPSAPVAFTADELLQLSRPVPGDVRDHGVASAAPPDATPAARRRARRPVHPRSQRPPMSRSALARVGVPAVDRGRPARAPPSGPGAGTRCLAAWAGRTAPCPGERAHSCRCSSRSCWSRSSHQPHPPRTPPRAGSRTFARGS